MNFISNKRQDKPTNNIHFLSKPYHRHVGFASFHRCAVFAEFLILGSAIDKAPFITLFGNY